MKFLLKVKKHQHYLYISILLIAIFFLGNSLITPKITSVTEDLIEDIVRGNLQAKQNIVSFEFNQLNSYLNDSKKIINESDSLSQQQFEEKLLFTSELALTNRNIVNSFVLLAEETKIQTYVFTSNTEESYGEEILISLKNRTIDQGVVVLDTIFKNDGKVINRKLIAKKITNEKFIIAGYDVDLLKFWKYFSETYKGEGGYTVLTDANGVCILHPETQFIGEKLPSFFSEISVEKILKNTEELKVYYVPENEDLIKTKVTSEYLGLEVLRYFKAVKYNNSTFILIVSIPVDIYLKESIVDIKKYFSWISLLAFCTFMLMLIISRIQLKKEFLQNLKFEKEKEQLASSNEKYQKENAVLQLNQLKKKMNPHFLFNSLNSLHVLIDLDSDLSQQFVLKLAEVYRYLLEDRDGNLITVKKELNFLKQYFFLQKIRFNNSLNLSIQYDCDNQSLLKKIPFLALETLVENAIKHNEITKQKPLFIVVEIKNDCIVVSNNYNPRQNIEQNSHYIGLNYLKNSYEFYQVNSFKTEISDEKFKCYLPLLS